jgi:hypothetical protein
MIPNILTSNSTKYSPFEEESPQLFKKFPIFHGTSNFIIVLTISTATLLSQLNQAVDFSKYFTGIYVFICICHARLILLLPSGSYF